MTAIFVGNGLGVERSSAWVLGARAQLAALGQAATGRAHENAYVNAANGNLVIQNIDEMLFGVGPDAIIARTYNSQGSGTDDNGDNWRASIQRVVSGLTGTVNTSGSTITRTDWDGSEDVYTYDTTLGIYVFKGDGNADNTIGAEPAALDGGVLQANGNAYDTLSFSGTTWTWRDGNSRLTETYDSANGGRITGSTDADGNSLAYTYTSGKLTRIATSNGEYTDLTWSGNNLTQLVTTYDRDGVSPLDTMTRIRYGYDASNRLTSVTVDLSPTDSSIADGKTYVTTYTYDGTSKRVASITQTDGSSLAVHYDTSNRVDQLTQTSASGVTRVTTLSYNTTTKKTTITDPAGQATVLTYDSGNRLTQIDAPAAVSGGSAQVTQFAYDSDGNLTSMTDPLGHVTTYGYDARGNRIWERDNLGNEVTRTFDATTNALLTESRWTGADPDAGGTGSSPSGALTTRFAYDSENHLRYVVSAEGYVTEYKYSAAGQQTSAVQYAGNVYSLTGLSDTTAISESTLNTWVSGITDKSTTLRTDTAYDFRGNVTTVTSFSKVLSSGAGDTTADLTKINYVYDQAGNLLKRKVEGSSTWEVYVYDGLNRITSTTDYDSNTTTIDFLDSTSVTRVTLANGLQRTSTYNLAGELISYAESGTGVTTATTSYAYDNLGRLRRVTDATSVKTYFLYDRVGRKTADIQADGSVTEYRYDADNRLIATIRYQNQISSTLLTQLESNVANQTYAIADYRPSSNSVDIWEWRVYDDANRLVQTIQQTDSTTTGRTTAYVYDAASRLVSTTAYALGLDISTFRTTPPTSLTLPTAYAGEDRTTRYFYDNDGRLTGTLDGEGYLTKIVYDAAGRKIETIAYSGATSTTYRAAGTYAQLLGSLTVDTTKDLHNWSVYDQRGFLRATINGEGDLTRYEYTALGYRSKEIRGQKTTVSTWLSAAPTLATLPSPGSDVLEATDWTYDYYGNVLSETRTLASGSETDLYTYDSNHQLLTQTTVSGTSDARAHRYRYDLRGRLTGEVWGVGAATLSATPTQTQIDTAIATYGISYAYRSEEHTSELQSH